VDTVCEAGNGRVGRLREKWFLNTMLSEKAWYIGIPSKQLTKKLTNIKNGNGKFIKQAIAT
jgi:hypothetical protein